MVNKIVDSRIERVIQTGLDINLLKKKSNASTFSGLLLVKMKDARDRGNMETAIFLQNIYKLYKDFTPKNINKIEILDGWKGKDSPEIYKSFDNDFTIVCHQKDKEGEVMKIEKQVSATNVNRLWYFIQDWKIGEEHKCYDFAKVVGESNWQEVWKKRTEVYFTLYYYPLKCLEAMNLIKYSARGIITRLK